MRGKVFHLPCLQVYTRITPAHAGKRMEDKARRSRSQDHPRPCGEKTGLYGEAYRETGSPPPMRGKGEGNPHYWSGVGITPAHAGKSNGGNGG